MSYYLASFRSQTQTYSFSQFLQNFGVMARVVQTPRQAQISCGLSVVFSGSGALKIARRALSQTQLASFAGFFEVVEFPNGSKQITKI